jgi:mono/diheme cytochrome c family protein
MHSNNSSALVFASLALAVCFLVGCGGSPAPEFRLNSVEWLKQERLNLKEGEHFSESYRAEISNLLTALFGTPDKPDFPFLLGDTDPAHKVISLKNLQMAAGPVRSNRQGEPAGLYREHCVQCHGISGDGLGPTAAFLNPYPRDFRLGKFKFKSTPLRRPPTDEDLARIIRNGIPGTAMPSFRTLSPEEVASLVDYVKYLSIRGQFERRLISELQSLDGDPLLNLSLIRDSSASDQREIFEEQLQTIVGEYFSDDIVRAWTKADQSVTKVPPAPRAFATDDGDHQALLETGKSIFFGKANCIQCHGDTGLGDGQTENFDDWTNDWLKTSGVDPSFRETYQPFIEAGALKPRHIRPRNLQMPVFRGGSRPEDIYRRIANGIEGTPMPSTPTLTPGEIWALVSYVKALPYLPDGIVKTAAPLNPQRIR